MKTTDQLYEELRAAIDNGNESMTHEDALEHVQALQGPVEALDNLAASLETVLISLGKHMAPGDLRSRRHARRHLAGLRLGRGGQLRMGPHRSGRRPHRGPAGIRLVSDARKRMNRSRPIRVGDRLYYRYGRVDII